jgi:histidinol dehydrogenase
MKIIRHTQPGFADALAALKRHAEPAAEVRSTVAGIIADVRNRGDAALLDYTEKFGGPSPPRTATSPPLRNAASANRGPPGMRRVLASASDSIRSSASASMCPAALRHSSRRQS